MDTGAFAAAGLYDPDAPGAAERLALLEYLDGLGATIEDLTTANDSSTLQRLVIELVRRSSGPFVSSRDVAVAADVELDVVERVIRAAGLPVIEPDVAAFRAEDADVFSLFAQGAAIFGEGPTLEFTRTIGAAMASIADSAMAVFGIGAASRFDEGQLTELERAQVGELASSILLSPDGVPRTIDILFFHHIGAAVRRSVAARSSDTRTATYAVGFLDLVASTSLNRSLGPAELAEAMGGFERDAIEVVAARGGRVVKTIGDEVMFVNPDPVAACETALAVLDAVERNPRLGTVRGGLAFGDLVLGYGDFYGEEVNLAARLVRAADPGQVLVSSALAARAEHAGLARTAVGSVVVAGFDEPVEATAIGRVGRDGAA